MRNNILWNHMRILFDGWKIHFKLIYEWNRYFYDWIDDEVEACTELMFFKHWKLCHKGLKYLSNHQIVETQTFLTSKDIKCEVVVIAKMLK